MIGMVMKLAPLGAGGAMAFTVGKYGVHSLQPLLKLMGSFYLTCLLFVLIVLGFVARLAGFSILRFLRYIRDELLVVLGTSSSEVALPPLMLKLERLGCPRQVVRSGGDDRPRLRDRPAGHSVRDGDEGTAFAGVKRGARAESGSPSMCPTRAPADDGED